MLEGLKGLFNNILGNLISQIILSIPLSLIGGWFIQLLQKKSAADVFSSLPHPYFLPILSALIIAFTFRPAIIDPINRARKENHEEEQIKLNDLIIQIDQVIEQFQEYLEADTAGNMRQKHYLKLEHMVHSIYAKIKEYDSPSLDNWTRDKRMMWYRYFLDLRSKLD